MLIKSSRSIAVSSFLTISILAPSAESLESRADVNSYITPRVETQRVEHIAIHNPEQSLTKSEECDRRVRQVLLTRLQRGRSLDVHIRSLQASSNRPSSLRSRPLEYWIDFSGRSAGDVAFSPMLLRSVASDMVRQCPELSSVHFGLMGTSDGSSHFGIIDNEVRQFVCGATIDELGYSGRDRSSLPWGTTVCD